jgi:hypothetical protein
VTIVSSFLSGVVCSCVWVCVCVCGRERRFHVHDPVCVPAVLCDSCVLVATHFGSLSFVCSNDVDKKVKFVCFKTR